MYVEIKDLDIMDVTSQDEITDGTTTYIPTDSFVEKENKKWIMELEKKCADIGMEFCPCDPPKPNAITGKIELPSPEDQVNKYSYHVLAEMQGGVYAQDQCIIRHCKKCGRISFFGNPMLMLNGVSMFYNAMISFQEMEITEEEEEKLNEGEVVEETVESDIPADLEEVAIDSGCDECCSGCTACATEESEDENGN